MVKNIINQGITDYGEDITTTNNPTKMTDLLGRYPGMDRIQELQNLDFQNNPRDMATGTASDFRHAAAMNELSKKATLGGLLPDVVGDTIAYGLGALNEAPDFFRGANPAMLAAGLATKNPSIMRAGLDDVSVAAGLEDDLANRLGTYGTPNTATIEDVFAKTLGYQAPGSNVVTQTASSPFNYGTAQAAEVDPFAAERGRLVEAGIDPMSVGLVGGTGDPNRPTMSDIAGLGDLGNPTGDPRVVSEEMGMVGRPTTSRPTMADIAGEVNENLRDLGNPLGDSRIASEEQGLSGFPGLGQVDPGFQNVLDAREARRNEIAMQQNPDYGQFFDAPAVNEQKRGLASFFDNPLFGLGMRLSPIGPLQDLGKLMGVRNAYNSFRSGSLGNAVSRARTGLGSLGSRFAGKMRGINPITGRPNTQSEYEQARTERQQQARTDRMIDRISKGKSTRSNPRDAGTTKAQKDAISAAIQDSYRGGGGGNSGGGGGGKIVCTMMNDSYGFGNFRNKIWLKHSRDLPKEYEIGYHTIFLPLVKFAKGEGKLNKVVKKTLEHIARHRTYDLKQEMKGKTHLLGRAYRKVLEPICFITGKIKSALGRG